VKAKPVSPQPQIAQLVFNPLSGNHSTARIEGLAEALRAVGFTVALSPSSPQHPLIIDPRARHICVAGGDGTVRHVVATLAGTGQTADISVYPLGTINLVAREWHVPTGLEAFARHVVEDQALRRLHPVALNDTYFVACASLGPDSRAVDKVSEALKQRIGRLAYGVSLARQLLHWERPKLTLVIEGKSHAAEAVYIAKGRYFAGPWTLAPEARLSSPWLHVVSLKRASRIDFLAFMIAVITGKTAKLANVETWVTKKLRIEGDRPHSIQIDGDIGAALPALISVLEVEATPD
jgi:diacylglycerol kinase (ATP)